MLNPDNRHLYLQSLKPPANYELEYGIGTTYTLDLTTLLMIPLAASSFSTFENKEISSDNIALFDSLQKIINKLTVFCQEGQIALPKNINLLYSFLDQTVVEAKPVYEDRVFHPKTWILKFSCDENDDKYRMVILSRNITFDKSWDNIVVLEGEKMNRINQNNKPLSDFISYLPQIAANKIPTSQTSKILDFAEEIKKVKFNTPEGFTDDIEFCPLGISNSSQDFWPFKKDCDRAMIVSPFISSNLLNRFPSQDNILISSADSLSDLQSNIKPNFTRIFILNDAVEELNLSDEEAEDIKSDINFSSGLHSKLFIQENDDKVFLWAGSANATYAAFNGNIEFLVGFQGNRPEIGIDKLLGDLDDDRSFINLLEEYGYIPDNSEDEDLQDDLTKKLGEYKKKILDLGLKLEVIKGSSDEEDLFNLKMSAGNFSDNDFLTSSLKSLCCPITRKIEKYGKNMNKIFAGESIVFKSMSLAALTSFIGFTLNIEENNHKEAVSFVLNLPVDNIPEKRNEEILYNIVTNRNKFIRYLIFLLDDEHIEFTFNNQLKDTFRYGDFSRGEFSAFNFPLMEEMLKALSRDPEKLDAIDTLLKKLKKSEKADEILPPGFDLLWEPLMKVRLEKFE